MRQCSGRSPPSPDNRFRSPPLLPARSGSFDIQSSARRKLKMSKCIRSVHLPAIRSHPHLCKDSLAPAQAAFPFPCCHTWLTVCSMFVISNSPRCSPYMASRYDCIVRFVIRPLIARYATKLISRTPTRCLPTTSSERSSLGMYLFWHTPQYPAMILCSMTLTGITGISIT